MGKGETIPACCSLTSPYALHSLCLCLDRNKCTKMLERHFMYSKCRVSISIVWRQQRLGWGALEVKMKSKDHPSILHCQHRYLKQLKAALSQALTRKCGTCGRIISRPRMHVLHNNLSQSGISGLKVWPHSHKCMTIDLLCHMVGFCYRDHTSQKTLFSPRELFSKGLWIIGLYLVFRPSVNISTQTKSKYLAQVVPSLANLISHLAETRTQASSK